MKFNTNYSKIAKRDLNASQLDELREFADEINGHKIGKSKSKNNGFLHKSVAPKFDRETPIVAGDKRPIWETQTESGLGVEPICHATANYWNVPNNVPGRVGRVKYNAKYVARKNMANLHARLNRVTFTYNYLNVRNFWHKKRMQTEQTFDTKTYKTNFGTIRGHELTTLTQIHKIGLSDNITVYDIEKLPIYEPIQMPKRIKKPCIIPDNYTPGKHGFYKPLMTKPQNAHINYNHFPPKNINYRKTQISNNKPKYNHQYPKTICQFKNI